MKKKILMLVSLLLVVSMGLIACGSVVDDPADSSDAATTEPVEQAPGSTEAEETTVPVDNSPYTVKETLMDSKVSKELYDIFRQRSNNRIQTTTSDTSRIRCFAKFVCKPWQKRTQTFNKSNDDNHENKTVSLRFCQWTQSRQSGFFTKLHLCTKPCNTWQCNKGLSRNFITL